LLRIFRHHDLCVQQTRRNPERSQSLCIGLRIGKHQSGSTFKGAKCIVQLIEYCRAGKALQLPCGQIQTNAAPCRLQPCKLFAARSGFFRCGEIGRSYILLRQNFQCSIHAVRRRQCSDRHTCLLLICQTAAVNRSHLGIRCLRFAPQHIQPLYAAKTAYIFRFHILRFQCLHQPVHLCQNICFFIFRLLGVVQLRLLVDGRLFSGDSVFVLYFFRYASQVDHHNGIALQSGHKALRIDGSFKAALTQHMAVCRLHHRFIATDRSRPQHIAGQCGTAAIQQWNALVRRCGNSLAGFKHGAHHFLRGLGMQVAFARRAIAQQLVPLRQHIRKKALIIQCLGS